MRTFFGLFSPTFFEYIWAHVILCSIMLWARTWETGKEASGWKPKNHETEGIGRVFFTLNVYPHTFFIICEKDTLQGELPFRLVTDETCWWILSFSPDPVHRNMPTKSKSFTRIFFLFWLVSPLFKQFGSCLTVIDIFRLVTYLKSFAFILFTQKMKEHKKERDSMLKNTNLFGNDN